MPDRQGPTGGQGVAGSNPVVPTAVGSPLFLVISPGQRAFLIPCGARVVDLYCGGVGTTCGPSVDTARFSRGYSRRDTVRCARAGCSSEVGAGPGLVVMWLWSCGEVLSQGKARSKRDPVCPQITHQTISRGFSCGTRG